MIIDKIKTYLNGRTDIKFEIHKPVLDTCNIGSIVDTYYIKVTTPVKSDMIVHKLHGLNAFTESFYRDLIKHDGFEDYVFEESKPMGSDLIRPKITYKNDQKETEISIKVNGHEIKRKGLYNKVIELEFF